MSYLKKLSFAILTSLFMFTVCDDGGGNGNPDVGGDCTPGVDCPDGGKDPAPVTPPNGGGYVSKGNDINNYRTIVIGTQRWMSENLDYDVPDVTTDVCCGNIVDNCAKYGRLYDWSTAMDGASSSLDNPSGVRGICPVGWHLPSDDEWTELVDYVGGSATAGTKLKSTSGWSNNGNGTDEYGFSALPGGRNTGSGCTYESVGGYWWSATINWGGQAWYRGMSSNEERVTRYELGGGHLLSVRCVQD